MANVRFVPREAGCRSLILCHDRRMGLVPSQVTNSAGDFDHPKGS